MVLVKLLVCISSGLIRGSSEKLHRKQANTYEMCIDRFKDCPLLGIRVLATFI